MHKAQDNNQLNSLVVKLSVNKDTRNLEFKQDMSETFFIEGEGVVSFSEMTDTSIHVPVANAVLILKDWNLT